MKNYALLTMLTIALSCIQISNAQQDYVKRINCGSTSPATFNGHTFDSDQSIAGVVTFTGDRTSNGSSYFTLAQPIKSIRYTKNQSMDYTFFVDNGEYQVILHFAEPYHGVQPGTNEATRKFDLDIDGQFAFSDINIMTEAGGANQIYTIDRTVTVTDGEVNLVFSKGSGNDPIINAIEVLGIDTSDNQDPSPPTLSSSAITTNSVDLNWNGATDNVDVTNYKIYKDGALETTVGDVNTYQVTGLAESTSYALTITALDAAGNESAPSNTETITTSSTGGGGGVWNSSGNDITYTNGNVAIKTTAQSNYALAVGGKIIGEEVKVQLQANWPDYVFTDQYDLPTLEEVQKFIAQNGHLINIPTATEVQANGIELGEMNRLLLEKIEELTLYLLAQEKRLLILENHMHSLEENN